MCVCMQPSTNFSCCSSLRACRSGVASTAQKCTAPSEVMLEETPTSQELVAQHRFQIVAVPRASFRVYVPAVGHVGVDANAHAASVSLLAERLTRIDLLK